MAANKNKKKQKKIKYCLKNYIYIYIVKQNLQKTSESWGRNEPQNLAPQNLDPETIFPLYYGRIKLVQPENLIKIN